MRIPVWLLYAVGVLVCIFGVHRIRIAFRSDEADARAKQRRGLYAMARRSHLLIGVVYLLLGAAVLATALGWNPMGSLIGPPTEAPPKGAEATHSGVPADGLPAPQPKVNAAAKP